MEKNYKRDSFEAVQQKVHMFSSWLKNKTCPHYFVQRCNLIYNTVQYEIIANQLVSVPTEFRGCLMTSVRV